MTDQEEEIRNLERELVAARAANHLWLTAEQAGVRIGCHAATIRKFAKTGKLRAHGPTRMRRFRADDVDNLLSTLEAAPTEQLRKEKS